VVRRRRRLRFRVMAAFALGGLLIPAGLSVLTYFWARTYLLDQRQTSAVHQAAANAQLIQPDVSKLLTSLQTPASAQSAVLYSGEWYGTSAVAGPDALPGALVSLVVDHGQSARQRYHGPETQVLAVGIPLADGDAFFEIFSLNDLDATLRTLRDALAAGSLLGFALSIGIGGWATGRVLRPVRDIGRAAAAIAGGRLDARLDPEGDRELAELATGFNAMVDSLSERIERDARFASDVSHELRSPLTTVRSAVEVMQRRRSTLDPRSARALDLLAEEVERFEQLVQDLLEISRYDAGVAQLDLSPVDLATMTAAVLSEAEQIVPVESSAPEVTIVADRRRLEQALRNLVRNAVVHAGGVTRVTIDTGSQCTTITVADEGPGISETERTAIFERFARGRASGQRSSGGGVGVGLGPGAESVALQGGSIWAESGEPRGSRFVIQLPTRRP
jgi:two-component system, OmpR family, sensor histidine kinase MtrB